MIGWPGVSAIRVGGGITVRKNAQMGRGPFPSSGRNVSPGLLYIFLFLFLFFF
jgi:hypothetical protein